MNGLRRRLAAAAPVPVFVVAGAGGRDAARRLAVTAEVEVVASPRHATVLLVAGTVPGAAAEAVGRLHDELPHPRAALWWDCASGPPPPLPDVERVEGDATRARAAVAAAHRAVVLGQRPSRPAVLPDVDPNHWRGVGPYGQGGKGMTGGTPYGRPMPGRAPDRDGLELDQLSVTLGPWLAVLPPGLVLEVKVQGDVVQEAAVPWSPIAAGTDGSAFARALTAPVPVAELELCRARHHLAWASEGLALLGLGAQARRVLRVADALRPGAPAEAVAEGARQASALASARRLRHPLRAIGTVTGHDATAAGGPVARAAGVATDARSDDPAYQALGFEPVVEEGGDAMARWRVRMREVAQSLGLAGAAGEAVTSPAGAVEGPRGPLRPGQPTPSTTLADLVPGLLVGLEWGDATVALASLDLEPSELAPAGTVALAVDAA